MLVQRVQVKEVSNVDVAVAVAAGPVGAAVLVIQGHDLPTVKQPVSYTHLTLPTS